MTISTYTDKGVQVGTAEAQPGKLVYGWFDIAELPTGHVERLPVIIAQGYEPGPVFWLTANIHGDELTGMAAIHDIVKPDIVEDLRGTIVAIPSLNPAGLRVTQRRPYFESHDPNRTFPGYHRPSENPEKEEREQKYPTIYETAMGRLFEVIKETADFLIDLHCYGLQAMSFTIRDRVLYHDETEKAAAEELYQRTDELCKAFGLPVVNEAAARHYVDAHLHRSTSGAALNLARIPAITVELGLIGGVDPDALKAARTGIVNSLKWAGMLPGELQPITTIPLPKVPFNTRRENQPRAAVSGIIRYHVKPGDVVEEGQVIATLTDIYGRVLPVNGEIRAESEGWIISLSRGGVCYQGQVITNMAVRDDEPMVEPFPD
ncbi:MAG TPA: succinylglutamate desuccinylase/aspartoacylase family protein [Chloroflexia bacterium]|nr:succinylglutamate desuccinylase/aspartoacylase family protein [Chloroflexia bacterium]